MKNLASILFAALLTGFILLVVSILAHAFVLAIVASILIIGSISVNAGINLVRKF